MYDYSLRRLCERLLRQAACRARASTVTVLCTLVYPCVYVLRIMITNTQKVNQGYQASIQNPRAMLNTAILTLSGAFLIFCISVGAVEAGTVERINVRHHGKLHM
jgi:hypothetical protein